MGSPAPYSSVPYPEQRHQRRRQPSRDSGAGLIRETSVEQGVMAHELPTPSPPQQQQQPVLRPHQYQMITAVQQASGAPGRLPELYAPTSDVDAAMARAMLAVISNSDGPNQARRQDFEPYDAAPKTGAAAQVRQGQGMIKGAPLSDVPTEIMESPAPAGSGRQLSSSSNSQMNHVMSERKRREKLNESFHALWSTLPPATKRDKASVLAGAMDVVKSLRAEISELEGKNRSMEARLPPLPPPADGTTGRREERAVLDRTDDDPAAAGDRILVRVVKIDHDKGPAGRRTSTSSAGGSSSSLQRIQLRVAAPVPESGDVVDLVLHVLECLEKAIGGVVKLVSLEAGVDHGRQIMKPIGRAVVTMQIKMDDWDEDSFKRSIARAV